ANPVTGIIFDPGGLLALTPTTTTLSISPNPSVFGQTVASTAAVSPLSSGRGPLTGTVQFSIDGTNVGPVFTLSGGIATFTFSNLLAGTHSITASYSGDNNFAGSTSSSLTQIVLTRAQATQNLVNTINGINLDQGKTTSLDAKLQAAISSFNPNNNTAAKNQLNA